MEMHHKLRRGDLPGLSVIAFSTLYELWHTVDMTTCHTTGIGPNLKLARQKR